LFSPASATYSYSHKDGLQFHLREHGQNISIPAPFKPYFFVKKGFERAVEYYAKRKNIAVSFTSTELKTLDEQPVVKVEVDQPYQVATLRDVIPFETFEADIPWVRRVCLRADTRISLPKGKQKRIVDLKVGDVVLTFDGKHVVPGVVKGIYSRKTDTLCRVCVAVGGQRVELYITPEHPIYTSDGWKRAGDVRVGDKVLVLRRDVQKQVRGASVQSIANSFLRARGRGVGSEQAIEVLWSEVTSVERFSCTEIVYNIDVDPYHNYFAEGVLVHNCIDMDWHPPTTYVKLYYDIECKDDKIVCIAVAGEDGEVEVLKGDEKSILTDFTYFAEQVDMLLGYNSSNYDVPVLKKRFSYYGLKFPNMQRWYDLLSALQWKRQRMLPSWGLDYVGKNLVGIERLHTDKPFSQLTMQEIYERCQRDVEITRELDKKFNLSAVDIMKAHISYVFPDETIYISRCIDSLLLKQARELGYVLPNKPVSATTQPHSGAFVAQPPEPFRVYKNVLFLDVVSLYPSIIISFKISPDSGKQLYPSMLKQIISERLKYKKLYRDTHLKKYDDLQYAYKILANASYGVFNAPGFRIQRPDLGDEVARRGREIVTSLIKFYESLGFNVPYADTDSCVLTDVEPDVDHFMSLAEAGSKHIKEIFNIEVQVEAKKFFSKLYFMKRAVGTSAAKKKYAGTVIWTFDNGWLSKPELDVVGIEVVRSDFPPAAQKLQQQLIEGYLNGKTRTELQTVLLEFKAALFNGLISPDELALSRSITRKNYKVTAPHVKAAAKLKEAGVPVNIGDKIRFVYTRWGPLPVEQCNGVPIDTQYYWKNIFERIAERTLGITGDVKLDRWMHN